MFASGCPQVKSAELRGFLVVVGRAGKACAENSADFLRTGCGLPQGVPTPLDRSRSLVKVSRVPLIVAAGSAGRIVSSA